jgi:hypothetical protein
MRVRDMVATVTGVLALAVPATAAGDALIGDFDDGNDQAANSNQSAINGTGGAEFSGPGVKFIPGNSAPKLVQGSLNVETNSGLIGGGGGDETMIGDGHQANNQAINSNQVAKKGTQVSTNLESGTQIVGLGAGDTVIGSTSQASNQGEDSLQTAASRSGTTTFIGGPTNKGPLTETSSNTAMSCEIVIGGFTGATC